MDLLTDWEEARMYREVAIAAVRAALAGWKSNQELAADIGVSRGYLQYLLRVDGLRTPGPETAARIVNALPLPSEQREDLLKHLTLAAEHRLSAWRAARQLATEGLPSETVERMRAAHWAAVYANEPERARPHYQVLRDLAVAFLRTTGARRQPLPFVETCMLLHDAQSVLDRPGDALFHGQLASAVMRRLDRAEYRRGQERFDHLRVNALYAQAVTLSTLGLARQAEGPLGEAEVLAGLNPAAGRFWLPHIYRRQLAVWSLTSRFNQYTARDLANRAKSACDARDDPLNPQVHLLIDESLARAYLRYGSASRARTAAALLRPGIDSLARVPFVGPLHQVVVLKNVCASLPGQRCPGRMGALHPSGA